VMMSIGSAFQGFVGDDGRVEFVAVVIVVVIVGGPRLGRVGVECVFQPVRGLDAVGFGQFLRPAEDGAEGHVAGEHLHHVVAVDGVERPQRCYVRVDDGAGRADHHGVVLVGGFRLEAEVFGEQPSVGRVRHVRLVVPAEVRRPARDAPRRAAGRRFLGVPPPALVVGVRVFVCLAEGLPHQVPVTDVRPVTGRVSAEHYCLQGWSEGSTPSSVRMSSTRSGGVTPSASANATTFWSTSFHDHVPLNREMSTRLRRDQSSTPSASSAASSTETAPSSYSASRASSSPTGTTRPGRTTCHESPGKSLYFARWASHPATHRVVPHGVWDHHRVWSYSSG